MTNLEISILSYLVTAFMFCLFRSIGEFKDFLNNDCEFDNSFGTICTNTLVYSILWPLTVVFVIVGLIMIKRDEYLTNKAKRKSGNSDMAEVETSAVINWSMTSDTDRQNIKTLTTFTLNDIRNICINFRSNMYHDAAALGYNTPYQKFYKEWFKSKLQYIDADVVKSMAEANDELTRRNLYINPVNWATISTLSDIDATYYALCQFADKAKADEANSIKPND